MQPVDRGARGRQGGAATASAAAPQPRARTGVAAPPRAASSHADNARKRVPSSTPRARSRTPARRSRTDRVASAATAAAAAATGAAAPQRAVSTTPAAVTPRALPAPSLQQSAAPSAAGCQPRGQAYTTYEVLKAHPTHSFLADNEAIVGGYRWGLDIRGAIMSFFAWHNETINVWTHALGAATFIVFALMYALHGLPTPSSTALLTAASTQSGHAALYTRGWCATSSLRTCTLPLGYGAVSIAGRQTWGGLAVAAGVADAARASPACPLTFTLDVSGTGAHPSPTHPRNGSAPEVTIFLPTSLATDGVASGGGEPHAPLAIRRLVEDMLHAVTGDVDAAGDVTARLHDDIDVAACAEAPSTLGAALSLETLANDVRKLVPACMQLLHMDAPRAASAVRQVDDNPARGAGVDISIPTLPPAMIASRLQGVANVIDASLAAAVQPADAAHAQPAASLSPESLRRMLSLRRMAAALRNGARITQQVLAEDWRLGVDAWEHVADRLRAALALNSEQRTHSARRVEVTMNDGRSPTVEELAEDAVMEAVRSTYKSAMGPGPAHTGVVAQWPVLVFLLSAVFCMGSSATFHLLHVVDRSLFELLSSVDYSSISVLIWGSSVPIFYYGFFCMPVHAIVYGGLLTAVCFACMWMGFDPRLRTVEWRTTRTMMFVGAGAFGGIPMAHMTLLSNTQHDTTLQALALMGALYLFGALLYGLRVPERFFPGKFDKLLASHQIFHTMVFAACLVHYGNVLAHHEWRVAHSVCEL